MTRTVEARKATLFTPESANRALLYVKGVVDDLVESCVRLRRAKEARARALAGNPSAGVTERERAETLRKAEADRRSAQGDFDRIGRELESVGVTVKDPTIGLIDFPGEIDGRRVLLCWKQGEERVAFWHDLNAGIAGRRPIPPEASAAL